MPASLATPVTPAASVTATYWPADLLEAFALRMAMLLFRKFEQHQSGILQAA